MKKLLLILTLLTIGCAHTNHTHTKPPIDPCSFSELGKTIGAFDADQLTSSEMQSEAGDEIALCEMEEILKRSL